MSVHFSSKKHDWETPQELFDELDKEFHFTLDVCATKQNAKCKKFYTKKENGLILPWEGRVFFNPPYGREISNWVERAGYATNKMACALLLLRPSDIVVGLLPARTDTKWFHDYIYNKPNVEIRFLKGRLKFSGHKNSAPFPSMIVIWR